MSFLQDETVRLTALFVLPAAAAEAGIVATDCSRCGTAFVTADDIPCKKPVAVFCIIEKRPVCITQVVPGTVIEFRQIPQLYTAPLAEPEPGAVLAFIALQASEPGELMVFRPLHDFIRGVLKNVAEIPRFRDKKIAGEYIAVVLDNKIFPARILVHAALRRIARIILQEIIKEPYAHIRISVCKPLIKQCAQKMSVPLGRNRKRRFFTINDLETGDKLEIVETMLDKKTVYFFRMLHGIAIHHRQDIEINPVFIEDFTGFHYEVKNAFPRPCKTVDVMEFTGTVKADADQKPVFIKKTCPVIVDENAIGLDGV